MTMDVANLLERNAPGFELDAVEDAFPDYEVAGELTEDDIWAALQDVEDPELPVSLVNLGLIKGVDLSDGHVDVKMTLTYTGCPAREIMLKMVERRLELLDGVESVDAELDYTEPWKPEDMTDEARDQLGDAGFACPLSGRSE